MLKQAQSSFPSPEDLLQTFQQEFELRRARREASVKRRGVVLGMSLLLLVAGTVGALMMLFSMLREMPHPDHRDSATADSLDPATEAASVAVVDHRGTKAAQPLP